MIGLQLAQPGRFVTSEVTADSPHRIYPEVITLESLPDDKLVYGEAMPLVRGWREPGQRHRSRPKPG